MLYDNAQLARVYIHAWQLTGHGFYRHIVEETLDYVAREMRASESSFRSTQDADSEGSGHTPVATQWPSPPGTG